MTTAAEHARRFPGCRSTTLAQLIKQEALHAQMRKEQAAKRSPLVRLWQAVRRNLAGEVR